MQHNNTTNDVKIVRYSDFTAKSGFTTVPRNGSYSSTDEIAYTRWQYEKLNGGPDLRYKDNPSTTYIYRGYVDIISNV